MSDEPSHVDRSHRKRVTLVLAFLSSEDCRQACHQILAPERFAYEWCRLWFDEIYVPSLRYLEGLKGDRSEEAAAQFRACFTDEEQEALERFHRFLELRVERLSDEAHRRESFPQTDAWASIVRHAGYVLEDLDGVDPDAVRDELVFFVRTLTQQTAEPSEVPEQSLVPVLHEALQQGRLPD